jgi:putative NIF3 family GTP cyclohydrolase 1 type 2
MNSANISPIQHQSLSRRKFINTGFHAAAMGALVMVPGSSTASNLFNIPNEYTVQNIIDIILKAIPVPLSNDTVDTIKAGSAGNKVTGVVTTMFPTIAVIKEAIRLKANFIIPHEPSFYNHADKMDLVENNEVQQKKLQLLNGNNITIWRAHDSWHAIQPDGILYGVVKKTGWEQYYKTGEKTFTIPSTQLKDIISHLKSSLQISHVKVIGDVSQSCKKIALLPGAWGGLNHIRTAVAEKPDLLIIGEANEWETPEYIRDARLMGMNISMIVLGHAVSEEPGMEWMAEWLQPRLHGIKVTHVPSKDPFTWL